MGEEKLEKQERFITNAMDDMPQEMTGSMEDKQLDMREILPCIPLRGLSVFPHTVVHFDIGREMSVRALEHAMATDKILFVSSQKDEQVMIPTVDDLYNIGTVIRVKQMLRLQGDVVRVLVEGITRAIVDECVSETNFLSVSISRLEDDVDPDRFSIEDKAELRVLSEAFTEYAALTQQITDEIVDKTLRADKPEVMVDRIANELIVEVPKKQKVLEALIFSDRIKILNSIIAEENEIAVVEKNLSDKVKEGMNKSQRDYYLREKVRAIQSELGYEDDPTEETQEMLEKLDKLKLSKKTDEKVRKEIDKFSKMQPSSAESAVIRNYVETILDLPWHKSSKVNNDLKKAEDILNEDHYGLKDVKERVLEYLAVTHLSKSIRGPILCLVGPPGVGKTSIARSIARATGREFVRMSLGGIMDEAEIRGHRRTYIGAIPGRVISNIRTAGKNNPLFLLDEIDKLGHDFRGDPASALLEVLDPEQNSTFTDSFLEVPFDLSKVMFLTTANTAETIPEPLLDRMELIEVPGYIEQDKIKIAQKYLIPKQIKENGLTEKNIKITENTLHDLINFYTRESGVRNLEREIANLCRKVAKQVVLNGKDKCYTITPKNLEKYLGKHRFHYDTVEGENKIGVTTGLAWTAVGGVTLQIETAVLPGSGKIELTGKLGDVMQESARTGISYIRSVADKYGIDPDFYKDKDLHIHIPEGAVPKDGPSAGVTMCTAVISALSGRPVRREVAMTGEITLRGDVLPVGGVREKVLAAHRAGIKKVLLPRDNEVDIEELPAQVRHKMEFVLLDNVDQALDEALVKE